MNHARNCQGHLDLRNSTVVWAGGWLLCLCVGSAARAAPPVPAVPATPVVAPTATSSAAPAGVMRDCNVCPDLVSIPAGNFMMGSAKTEADRETSEGPQRRVNVGAFLLGKFEVTQGQWKKVMGNNPSIHAQCGDDCPVDNISWDNAHEYIKKLTEVSGKSYRLPTEAEWEYASRGGSTTPFYTGTTITTEQANFDGTFSHKGGAKGAWRQASIPVGSFPANPWGLHDMLGNVSEWTQDVWHENYDGAPMDGSSWSAGGDQLRRVVRGGSWYSYGRSLRSATRIAYTRGNRLHSLGLRVARGP